MGACALGAVGLALERVRDPSHGVILRGLLGLSGSALAREEKAREQEQDRLGG